MPMNVRKNGKRWLATAALATTLGLTAGAARAQDQTLDSLLGDLLRHNENTNYSRIASIQVPGKPLAVFDISFVDPVLPLYYLADRSNAALDIVDTRTNTIIAQVGGFVGVRKDPATGLTSTAVSGPDGVATVGPGEIWVGDGDSSVKVVDIVSQKVTDTISTVLDGQDADTDKRADEMFYDPRDNIMLVANNAATPPYVTFISTLPNDHRVLGHIVYSDADGVEASVYDPKNGLFYVNLTVVGKDPVTGVIADPNIGAVSVVDPRQLKEIGRFPVTGCNGAGIDLAPGQKLVIGCSLTNNSQIISARDGSLLAELPQVSGSDQIWYNRGDGRAYLAARNNSAAAGGPVLGIIDTLTNTFVTNIPTDVSAHSVAADARTGNIFVPFGPVASDPNCTSGCIAVYNGQRNENRIERDVERFITDLSASQ